MNSRPFLVAGLLVLAPLACSAEEPLEAHVRQSVRGVERGYARVMGTLSNSTHEQPSALGMTYPFGPGASPFAPRVRNDFGWSLAGVNAEQSALCLKVAVRTEAEWNSVLVGMSKSGLAPARAQDCTQLSRFEASPLAFPATIAGVKLLDRRDTPVPTIVPADPQLTGVDAQAITRPGLVVQSFTQPAYKTIGVTNPAVIVGYTAGPPSVPIYRRLTLTKVTLRDGFVYNDNCSDVGPNQTCNVQVRYMGTVGDHFPGSLRLEFSNGGVAVIGLLGRTQ